MGFKEHFGREMKRLREAAGLTRKQLGEQVGYNHETIKSFETGHRTPTVQLAGRLDEIFGTSGMFAELQKEAKQDGTPFGELRENEQRARAIRIWEMRAVPGLLQTPRYAKALLRDGAEVDARIERQGIFARDNPPHVHVIIGEGVLYMEFGGPSVLREQLAYLIRPDAPWTLQVMPDQAGSYTGSDGPLVLLDFPEGEAPIAFLDSRNRGTVVDDENQVSMYWQQWERMIAEALSPDLSREMIAAVIADLPEA